MNTFYKTELGFRTLKLRDLELNARQRRLLVLIGTDDFHALSQTMQQRIASPDLLQQLIDLGLIIRQSILAASSADTAAGPDSAETADSLATANLAQHSEIQTSLQISPAASPECIQPQQKIVPIAPALQPVPSAPSVPDDAQLKSTSPKAEMTALDFEALKTFMVQHLQQYCGLMAKQLIFKIQAAEKIAELKLCQMQWITLLQESRILPKILNDALQQVNLSMRTLQAA
ncbi:hypothetical protein [Acinetobacter sp.]|uniref:hypothetical protein n=1 Tax=Acinetobacter sp. TaxID=472 RepID=UPI0035B2BD01